MKILRAGGALLVLAGCAGGPRISDKGFMLAYGGDRGEVRRYAVEQTLRGRISTQGMPQLAAIKSRARIEQSVIRLLDRGRRRIAVKYGIVSLEINGAELVIAEGWKRMKAEFVRAPSGVIEEQKKNKESDEMLAWIVRGLETFFPVFPEEPVRVGDRWTRSNRPADGKGGMETRISATFSGIEIVDGITCAILELKGAARGARPSAGEGLGEFELKYSGVAHFDMISGRLMQARQKGTFRAQVRTQGISAEARLNFIAQIQLLAASKAK